MSFGYPLVVGFDFDMTLADSRDGIVAAALAALTEQGMAVSTEKIVERIGVPLGQLISGVAPEADLGRAERKYREVYADVGIALTRLMCGAAESIAAVHCAGGRAIVLSAKFEGAVEASLIHLGLVGGICGPDQVVSGLFAEQKGELLLDVGAFAYVGDHPGDMIAAGSAGAIAVGVPTGSHSVESLRGAGADVILRNLCEFPLWLRGMLRSSGGLDR